MDIVWWPLFSLILVSALIIHEEWVSTPLCDTLLPTTSNIDESESESMEDHPQDLKVMMVADLLLLGSDSGYLNRIFRDYYTSKFFRKSFQSLEPDMLVVLGDVSARGAELTKSKWLSVIHQFHGVLGPFLGLPLHVVLGDRDVGRCSELSAKSVNWIAGRFPGLDSTGCGSFEIGNVSFVSLNAVALLCGNNDLRFGVEKVIERESSDLSAESEADRNGESFGGFGWRENGVSSGSGPVVLLHFPLRQIPPANFVGESNVIDGRGFVGAGPYTLMQNLPANATEYIFQALKPRIIFTAHSYEFSAYTHPDRTYEVTVPAMTWNARDDPGFIVAIFRRNKRADMSAFTGKSFSRKESISASTSNLF
ncbi:metallophosphoesterase 1 isoform X2 [Morus notabilis]|uniref:metallophosphoesterase 1 isoform X2 n=1 Tax=Morus notabilis TaxID=981085 RepID=UPI000CED638D|nr:metallophosphoesterase 1 isoform X2 [Morus notabilis]